MRLSIYYQNNSFLQYGEFFMPLPLPVEALANYDYKRFNDYIFKMKQNIKNYDEFFELFKYTDLQGNNCLHIAVNTGNINTVCRYIHHLFNLFGKDYSIFLLSNQMRTMNMYGFIPTYFVPEYHPINRLLNDLKKDPKKTIEKISTPYDKAIDRSYPGFRQLNSILFFHSPADAKEVISDFPKQDNKKNGQAISYKK
jgi:hypothetical protein